MLPVGWRSATEAAIGRASSGMLRPSAQGATASPSTPAQPLVGGDLHPGRYEPGEPFFASIKKRSACERNPPERRISSCRSRS
jgi:hypothetical protein